MASRVAGIIFIALGAIGMGVGLGIVATDNPSNQTFALGMASVILGCTIFLSGIVISVTSDISFWLEAIHEKIRYAKRPR